MWFLVLLDRWLSYTVTIICELVWADSTLIVLDGWWSYRGGHLNRFDCITFLLTFIFCSLFRPVSFTKYALNIFSHIKQCYHKKKNIYSIFSTFNMQTSLAICLVILNTKKHYYLYKNKIT